MRKSEVKKKLWGSVAAVVVVVVAGLGGKYYMDQQHETIEALYPTAPGTFVGDPMPYYDGQDFLIYYLEDHRDGEVGFHPFSLFKTRDFYHYQNAGEVIPYVNEADDQERALGTGSVIKDEDGLYHAFYTAHNGDLDPKEAIMHATSKDGEKWDKLPDHTFFASSAYEANDFRDPYVFYVEESNNYWMLITTRQDGTGVIAKYVSDDLETWTDDGVFFKNDIGNDSNLECPSVVFYEGKWYLAFSDQWDQRVVHYRVADSLEGPFEKPERGLDHVDGAGFYAGRLETDGENLYLVGWIPTKDEHDDRFNYNWAGNLAVHQLRTSENGLVGSLPETARKQIETKVITAEQLTGETIPTTDKAVIYSGKIKGSDDGVLALSFSKDNQVLINLAEQTISYRNTTIETLERGAPKTEMPIVVSDGKFDLEIVKEQDIVVVYVNGRALSNRIYKAKTSDWKFVTVQGKFSLD